MAQDTETISYTKCAETLRKSILRVMPDSNVTIITTDMLPHGNLGGFANDWQVYEASPYDYTIKLEADMYIPRNIDHWWDVFKDRDVVVSSTIRNFKQEISDVRVYRRFIDDNNLPVDIDDLKKFLENILNVYTLAVNEFQTKYKTLTSNRSVKGLIDL